MSRTAAEQIELLKAAFPGKDVAISASLFDGTSRFSQYNAHADGNCTSSMKSLDHAVDALIAAHGHKGERQDATEAIDQIGVAAIF